MKYLAYPRVLLVLVTGIFVVHAYYLSGFVCDDAFISFRYARNFIQGHGLVWNIGEQPPVEGYTNFLWIMLISLVLKMDFDPVISSKVLSFAFGLGGLYLTYLFSKTILRREGPVGCVAPLLLACCGPYAAWSTEGLETSLFTFLSCAACVRYLYEIQHDRTVPLSALLFSLASLTRPEGVLLFGITCLHRVYHCLVSKKSILSGKALLWLGVYICIYGSYYYGRLSYYGFIFPNTFYAKTGGGIYQCLRGLRYALRFLVYNPWTLLAVLSITTFRRSSRSPLVYVTILVTLYSAYITIIGGDFLSMFRFFVPLLPLIAILVQEGLVEVYRRLSYAPDGRSIMFTLCYCSVLILALSIKNSFHGAERDLFFNHQSIAQHLAAEGKWLSKHALSHETVAAIGVGAIAYYSGLTVIDRLGITDAYVAHTTMPQMGRGFPGHEKRSFGYILSKKPDYFFGTLGYPPEDKNAWPSKEEIAVFNSLYEPLQIHEDGLNITIHRLRK